MTEPSAVRVLVACGWPRPLGAVVHAGRLAAALRAAGIEVQAAAAQPATDAPVEGGMLIVPVGEPTPGDDLGPASASARALAVAAAATPAHVGHAEDPVAAAALLGMRDRGELRAVVTTVHHITSHDRGGIEDLQRRAVQEADVTVCASQWWAGRIRDDYGVDAAVVPHGIERDRFAGCPLTRRAAGDLLGWGERPAVLALGGVQPRKGSRVLLEAFARARRRIGDGALLVVAGPAEHHDFHRAWCEDAERLGLRLHRGEGPPADADVVELGAVPSGRMPELYRACDVLASPSTREGFGLVALEAAASGLPCVLSDLAVFREHFTDGESCLTVPAGDSGALAQALVRAMHDAPLRMRLVAGGADVARRFTWDACAGAHVEVYRRALQARAA
jgi:glycosyltransferase involved in cell wall biosynthesis